MTASQRRTVIVSVVALGVAVVLVWAASTGPTGLVGGAQPPGDTSVAPRDGAPTSAPSPSAEAEPQARSRPSEGGRLLADLATYVGVIVGLWFVLVLLRVLLTMIRRRLPEEQLVLDLDPLAEADRLRESLSQDRTRHQEALDRGDVRSGIVACWVLLEESAAEAGVPRLPAETATEFVVHFLHLLDVDPRPVGALAGLYREARFSSHPMAPGSRASAEAALDSIHHDLGRSRVP